MKSQKQPTGVIHGVMDDEWARRVNETLANIYARSRGLVITKLVMTKKDPEQCREDREKGLALIDAYFAKGKPGPRA